MGQDKRNPTFSIQTQEPWNIPKMVWIMGTQLVAEFVPKKYTSMVHQCWEMGIVSVPR